jgi:hypothetical protein
VLFSNQSDKSEIRNRDNQCNKSADVRFVVWDTIEIFKSECLLLLLVLTFHALFKLQNETIRLFLCLYWIFKLQNDTGLASNLSEFLLFELEREERRGEESNSCMSNHGMCSVSLGGRGKMGINQGL